MRGIWHSIKDLLHNRKAEASKVESEAFKQYEDNNK